MKEYYENENKLYKNILNMPDQLLMLDNSKLTPLQSNSILAMLHKSQIEVYVNSKDKPVEYMFDYRFEIKVEDLKMFNDMKKTDNLIMDNLHYIKDNVKLLQNLAFQSFDTRSFSSFTIFPEIIMSEDEFGKMILKYQLSTSLLKIIYNKKGYIDSSGDYCEDKTLYTPIYLDLLKESGLSKKSEICLYKMLLCLGVKFNYHPTISIYYPIEEFKRIVGLPLYKSGKSLEDEILDLFEKVKSHINFTPVYNLEKGKGKKYVGITIKCGFNNFDDDLIYVAYKNKTEEYERLIDENNILISTINKNIANTNQTKEKYIPVKQTESYKNSNFKSNIDYAHYEIDGSKYMLNKIVNCSNKDGIIKLILETKDYDVYCQKFANSVEPIHQNHIVDIENFKKGFRFRKVIENTNPFD